jgi:hypothetical protein
MMEIIAAIGTVAMIATAVYAVLWLIGFWAINY